MASGLAEAASIGRIHAEQEISGFGLSHASEVGNVYEIPEDWKDIVPYSTDSHEKRTCKSVMSSVQKTDKTPDPLPPPEKKEIAPVEEVEVLPIELPKDDDDLPQLRFKI